MVERELESIQHHGYAILEQAIDRHELAELTAALAPHATGPTGRRSARVSCLAGKGPAFLGLAEHPAVVAIVDRLLMPNYLLSSLQAIRCPPGEGEQPWHTDDAFYFVPRPHALPLAISVLWALDELAEDGGARALIPGSHHWGMDHPDARDVEAIVAELPAGSALVCDAALWHRASANRGARPRVAIDVQYCQPWLRPQESQLLIVPPEAARACSERMRTMLGYTVHPPFVGQGDGARSLRLVDAGRERAGEPRTLLDCSVIEH